MICSRHLRCGTVACALIVLPAGLPAQTKPLPVPRPLVAVYRFGWQSVPAARAKVRLRHVAGNRIEVSADAATFGMARSVWQMDATYRSEIEGTSLLPHEAEQVEMYRKKRVTTRLTFTPKEVVRDRTVTVGGRTEGRPRRFRTPLARDLVGALLWVRAQPLRAGESYALTVFPAASPYLARARVAGRESLRIRGRTVDAIRVELDLRGLQPDGSTTAVKKLRRARAWLSDDADRVVVRAEADVFIGSVVAELDRVEFEP